MSLDKAFLVPCPRLVDSVLRNDDAIRKYRSHCGMLLSCEKRRLLPPRRLLLHLVLLTRVRWKCMLRDALQALFESHRQLQNQSVEGFQRTLAVR